jgi:hypothetical protein
LITGSNITAEKLCNARELSVGYEQASKTQQATEDVTELIDTIIKLKGFISESIEVVGEMIHEVCLFGYLAQASIDRYKAPSKDWREG